MEAKDLDKKFDEGEDISSYLDFSGAKRPRQEQKRDNDVDLGTVEVRDKS